MRARTLAAQLGVRLGLAPRELARVVGVDAHTIRRLAREGVADPRAEAVLRRRRTLERHVEAQARFA